MPTAVVQGATLTCACGSAPQSLSVTSQSTVKIGGKLAATVNDNTTANIPPFGTCTELTAKASGTPTPCAMVAAGPWTPGSTTNVKIGNLTALLNTDTLKCTVAAAGIITITDPGQQQTQDT
jgi:uncharacterized Zn-binding protein involved in type VI secretion